MERLFWGNNVFGKFKTRIFLSIFFFPARRKMFLIDKKESSFSKEKRYYYQLNITACIPRCCFIKPKPSGFDNRSNSIHPYFPNRSSQSATLLETTPPPHPEELEFQLANGVLSHDPDKSDPPPRCISTPLGINVTDVFDASSGSRVSRAAQNSPIHIGHCFT